MTVTKLKNLLDLSIKMWLGKTGKSKIPLSKFKSAILTQYDSTVLAKYNITLYKNGKTVKVIKKWASDIADPLSTTFNIGNPWTTTSLKAQLKKNKTSKKIILAAKSQALIVFHEQRKHTLKFHMCLACRAAKAFIEWEFHFSPKIIANKTSYIVPESSLMDKLNETVMKYTIKPYLGIWAAGKDKTGGFTDGFDG